MLPEFPPPAAPAPPPSPPWRFWPDFWKGFGLCLLLSVVLGGLCLLVIGMSFNINESLGTIAMLCSTVVGLVPLALVTVIAFRRRPSGQRAGWIIGAVMSYATLILLPIVICFGVLAVAVGSK